MIKRFTSQHIIRATKLELDVFKTSGHIYDTEKWNVENFSRSMPSKFDLSFVYEKDIDIIGFTVFLNLFSLGNALYISIGNTILNIIFPIEPEAIPEGPMRTARDIRSGAYAAVLRIIPAP